MELIDKAKCSQWRSWSNSQVQTYYHSIVAVFKKITLFGMNFMLTKCNTATSGLVRSIHWIFPVPLVWFYQILGILTLFHRKWASMFLCQIQFCPGLKIIFFLIHHALSFKVGKCLEKYVTAHEYSTFVLVPLALFSHLFLSSVQNNKL